MCLNTLGVNSRFIPPFPICRIKIYSKIKQDLFSNEFDKTL